MIKSAWSMALALAFVVALTASVRAEEGKEVKLEGTITCAKCDLGKSDECATVIKVKDEIYYFDTKGDKKNHKEICKKAKEGTVTGTVSEKDGKKTITVTKVEFK
jgi:hypothetical protein